MNWSSIKIRDKIVIFVLVLITVLNFRVPGLSKIEFLVSLIAMIAGWIFAIYIIYSLTIFLAKKQNSSQNEKIFFLESSLTFYLLIGFLSNH
jgi:hypothetical protein